MVVSTKLNHPEITFGTAPRRKFRDLKIAIKQSFRRLTGSSPLFNFAWFLKQKEVLHSYAKPLINYGDDGESFAFIEPVPPVVAVHGSSFLSPFPPVGRRFQK